MTTVFIALVNKESPLSTTVNTRFSDLLLEILHCDTSLPNPDRLLALSTDDWNEFTTEAIRFRMAFQVKEFFDADSQYGEIVPQVCLDRLGETVRKTLMNNLRQQAHLLAGGGIGDFES